MSPSPVGRGRLASQRISTSRPCSPAELVHHFGAIQGQDYSSALWGIGLRAGIPSERLVEAAVADRSIVRSWTLRGTLHFIAATDLRWMLSLLSPRLISSNARRSEQLDLSEEISLRSNWIVRNALSGGRTLPRQALYDALEAGGIETSGQRGYHLLWRAAQDQVICWASREGSEYHFALLDEWLPDAPPPAGDPAAILASRYFDSHGPATLADFIWWSGLATADARRALDQIKSDLVEMELDGRVCWGPVSPGVRSDNGPGDAARESAYLLPSFDEFIVGYRDRGDVLDASYNKVVNAGGGMLRPVLVIGGRVVGIWKRVAQRESVRIEVRTFRALMELERETLDVEVARYASFLGLEPQLSVESWS